MASSKAKKNLELQRQAMKMAQMNENNFNFIKLEDNKIQAGQDDADSDQSVEINDLNDQNSQWLQGTRIIPRVTGTFMGSEYK